MNLLIKNGRLIDPASGVDGSFDILIADGTIARISPRIDAGDADILDAKGLTVSPGFIDIHVHLREPGQEHKETIETGVLSAARGGFTSIVCMPNTTPVNDNVDTTRLILAKAEQAAGVNVFPAAAVSKGLRGKEPVDYDALYDAGVRGFTDDGRCVMDPGIMRGALEKSETLGVPIMEHAEDHGLSGDGHLNEGRVSEKLGLKGIPAEAEDGIVRRDIKIREETGGRMHITHLSTVGAMEAIRAAKARGVEVTADVTPHHLVLTEDLIAETEDGVYKMKPPLRTEADRAAMVEGIQDGTIDCIATDHAPHAPKEKERGFDRAAFGVIGMETAFPVVYDRLVRTGIIDLARMVELFSLNPAKVMNFSDRGRVAVGMPADLTILDLERPFDIKAEDFVSKSVNCPFIGWTGKGAVAYTIVNGNIIYKNE